MFCLERHTDRTPEPGRPAGWRTTRELGQLMASQCPYIRHLVGQAPTGFLVTGPDSQAGFRSHLRSCYKHGFELRHRH